MEGMADSSDGSGDASRALSDTHDDDSEEEPHAPSATEVRFLPAILLSQTTHLAHR
jgi:hypothetical protein